MESLKKQAAKLLGEQKKYRRWLTIFLCLAVVVTAGTLAALKMNGQALSHKQKVLKCGLELHEHTEDCYESDPVTGEKTLICGYADYVVHTHNDDCYDADGELVCQLEEVEAHIHDESCYEEQKVLVCEMEESEGHKHTESCRALICGKTESEGHTHTESCRALVCGKTEGEGHTHTESCRGLICEKTEGEGHQHTDACRTMSRGDLICENTEEGHEHTDECYEQVETITCGLEEAKGHTHTESCYDPHACGLEEAEGHTHTESCYDPYACGLEETEGHKHTESCYDPHACGLEETEGHTHTDKCYKIVKVPVCGKLELHTHITAEEAGEGEESCYDEEGKLICKIPELREHIHGEDCFETVELTKEEVEAMKNASGESEENGTEASGEGEDDKIESSGAAEDDIAGTESVESKEADSADGTAADNVSNDGNVTEDKASQKIYDDGHIRVVAEYDSSAGIPEAAELYVEKTNGDGTPSTGAANGDVPSSSGAANGDETSSSGAANGDVPSSSGAADGDKTTAPAGTQGGSASDENVGAEGTEPGTENPAGTNQPGDTAANGSKETVKPEETESGDRTSASQKEEQPAAESNSDTAKTDENSSDSEGQKAAETLPDAGTPEAEEESGAESLEATETAPDETAPEVNEVGTEGSGTASDAGTPQAKAESGAPGKVVPVSEIKAPETTIASESDKTADAESGTNGGASEEQNQTEAEAEEQTYRIGFRQDGKEILPKGTVTFTVWNLDEEGSEPETIVYSAGEDPASLTVTLQKKAKEVDPGEYRRVYEDETIRVIAEYGREANIPDEAELVVKQITPESDPELYAGYEEEFKEAVEDESAAMTTLFNIGFYLDGKEIEPDETVTIMIQFLDEEGNPIGKPVTGVHFAKDGAEVLDGSEVDEEGFVTFNTESFSPFGFTSVLLTSWVGFDLSEASGIPVYVYKGGEWKTVDKIPADTVNDYIFEPVEYIFHDFIGHMLQDILDVNKAVAEKSRWIGISYVNGEEEYITTSYYSNGGIWRLDRAISKKSLITGIYCLPENEEQFDKPLSELEIKGSTSCAVVFNPGNWNNSSRPQRRAYGTLPRVELEVRNPNGKAKIYLPGDNELGSPYVLYNNNDGINEETKIDLLSNGTKSEIAPGGTITVANENNEGHPSYMHRLVGWYDVINGVYYEVGESAREIEIDLNAEHVFYADWVAESYDFAGDTGASGNYIATEDTSDFITTRLFDYNELFNVYSTSVKRVDENGKTIEEWEDKGSFDSDESTRSFIFWEGDAKDLAHNGWKYDSSIFSVVTGNRWNGGGENAMDIHEGLGTSTLISHLFLEGRDWAEGVHYIGEGNYLYQHVVPDGDKIGYYIYDSDQNSATYQQSEGKGRFYIGSVPQSSPGGGKGFFPFSGSDSLQNYDLINNQVNYFFGMSSEINFYLPADSDQSSVGKATEKKPNQVDSKDMTFEFSGDDDVWVFLEHDGVRELVLDIGGIHDKQSGKINFTTGEVVTGVTNADGSFTSIKKQEYKNFKAGSYKMTVYYLERGAGESNCKIKFNIVPRYKIEAATANTLVATKEWKNTDSAPGEYIELSLLGKANREKFNNEDWAKIQNQLKLNDEEMAQYKAEMERQLKGYSTEFQVINTVKLATNGKESVAYTWEGLFPYCDYKVEEAEIPGYATEIVQKSSGGSYDYWVETAELNNGEFLILNKQGTSALACVNGALASEPMTVRYGVVVTQDQRDSSGIVRKQGIIPLGAIWTAESFEKGFALKNKETSRYLSLEGGSLQLSDTPYELKISDNLGDGLCDSSNRVTYSGNGFTALPNTGNSDTNTNTDEQRVRVYTRKNVASQVFHYTVTNTYTPNITIQKVDSKTGKKITAEEDAKFTLTRIVDGETDEDGNTTKLNAYYDGSQWVSTDNDAEAVVGNGENGQETGWFSLTNGAKAVREFPGGSYTLTERKAPTGYKLPENRVITFHIENGAITNLSQSKFSDGKTFIAEVDENNSLCLLVKNEQEAPREVKVCFTKYSKGNNPVPSPLSKAEFMLYRKWDENIDKGKTPDKQIDGSDVVKMTDNPVISDESGHFYTGELVCGVYYLEEIEAPDGYNHLDGIIEIVVEPNNESKKITVSIDADKTPVTVADVRDLTDTDIKDYDYEVQVFNTYGFELPETGSVGTKPFTIGGAMLFTATAILMYGYSMRRRKSERRLKK